MDDIWTIIGLSSLIASVVTVVLGIARDVLVERYRFKRQSEAGYIQSQIQVFSKIYFVLKRLTKGAVRPQFFKDTSEAIKEVNDIIEPNTHLLTAIILNRWLDFMVLVDNTLKEQDPEKKKELNHLAWEDLKALLDLVAATENGYLIPRYRKIVGETVAYLPND
jgi:hypothetical protein